MASEILDADIISIGKSNWGEIIKVYTRRSKKTTATTTTGGTTVTAASPPTTPNNNQTLATDEANFKKQPTLSQVSHSVQNHKRHKSSSVRKQSKQSDHTRNQFKSCNKLLKKLMKNKHVWVFNEPVNAKLHGLHDYHDIIKHPMDLGTIKSRLAQNFYKSPFEFADDVRLTFHNAMIYNPKGQDVHAMAEVLLNIFEKWWSVRYGTVWSVYDTNTYTNTYMYTDTKRATRTTAGPKKPKSKDLNKRDMTHEEIQKLDTNLQNLPPEKVDNIVQIIKKKNGSVLQHDDEIEVDIDSVDVETLWELDRFVMNYKKSLSKRKRKAELAQMGGHNGDSMEWTKDCDKYLLDILVERVKRDPDWMEIDEKIYLKFGIRYGLDMLKGKYHHLRFVHTKFSELIANNGVTWDATSGKVFANDTVWADFCKRDKVFKSFKKKGCKIYSLLNIVFSGFHNASTIDPQTSEDIGDCMTILEATPGVSSRSYTKALSFFPDIIWRKMFLMMSENRRKEWLDSLDQ